MDELKVVDNMQAIILKLPFQLREKWRDKAGQIKVDQYQEAMFPDLVNFIAREVQNM